MTPRRVKQSLLWNSQALVNTSCFCGCLIGSIFFFLPSVGFLPRLGLHWARPMSFVDKLIDSKKVFRRRYRTSFCVFLLSMIWLIVSEIFFLFLLLSGAYSLLRFFFLSPVVALSSFNLFFTVALRVQSMYPCTE